MLWTPQTFLAVAARVISAPFAIAFGVVFAVFLVLLDLAHAISRIVTGRSAALDLTGQSIVVTGAAGGFGKCIVRSALDRGAHVFAVDIVGDTAMAEALGKHDRLTRLSADVGRPEECTRVAKQIRSLAKDGQIFALVNNAGIPGAPQAVVEVTHENFSKVMSVNIGAAVNLTRELYPCMFTAPAETGAQIASATPRRSRVVNISSIAGFVASPGLASYVASKFALEGYTDSLRLEMSQKFIDVVLVEPFFAKTNIINHLEDVDEQTLKKSVLSDFFIRARRRSALWKSGQRSIMTADFVAQQIMRGLTDRVPQDRYIVFPNKVAHGIVALLMHTPNFFGVVDWIKFKLGELET